MSAIVCKFGGSAVTKYNAEKIKKIIESDGERRNAVVSAIGKGYAGQSKITDMLIELAALSKTAEDIKELPLYKEISNRHKELIAACRLNIKAEELMEEAFLNYKEQGSDFIISRGEYLSGKIISHYLGFAFIDSGNVVSLNEKKQINYAKSVRALKNALKGRGNALLTGFYGKNGGGIATFPRGGSDISGAILASAVNAAFYENYLDVAGLMVISPKIISYPLTVPHLSYSQMQQINQAGADVLHRDSVLPLIKKGIPIKLLNFYNPYDEGTLISKKKAEGLITIAESAGYLYNIFHPSTFEGNKIPKNALSVRFDRSVCTLIYRQPALKELSHSYGQCTIAERPCLYTYLLFSGGVLWERILESVKASGEEIFYMDVTENACSIASSRRISNKLYYDLV